MAQKMKLARQSNVNHYVNRKSPIYHPFVGTLRWKLVWLSEG
jgi:hypothetical protein